MVTGIKNTRRIAGAMVGAVLLTLATARWDVAAHEVNVHEALTKQAFDFWVSQRPELLGSCHAQTNVKNTLARGAVREDDPIDQPFGRFSFISPKAAGHGRYANLLCSCRCVVQLS